LGTVTVSWLTCGPRAATVSVAGELTGWSVLFWFWASHAQTW
jgi:hypothetical protein